MSVSSFIQYELSMCSLVKKKKKKKKNWSEQFVHFLNVVFNGIAETQYDPQCIHMDIRLVFTSYASLKHSGISLWWCNIPQVWTGSYSNTEASVYSKSPMEHASQWASVCTAVSGLFSFLIISDKVVNAIWMRAHQLPQSGGDRLAKEVLCSC